eukprot:XP_011660971.1 PREDICTED: uncharacterized protein LOC587152 isoform X2 [Strongylocentrotus purpuratus]
MCCVVVLSNSDNFNKLSELLKYQLFRAYFMLPIARGVHHLILRVIVSQAAAMVRAETPWILILLSVCWTEGQSDVVQVPIGLESGAIAASSLTASSQWAETYGPERGRLNIDVVKAQGGGWVAKKANTKQWIQVDLLTPYHITGVATQGQSGEPQWVTSFKIACSMDDEIFDTVKDPDYPKSDKIFPANSDRNTVVFNPLPAILCRYVRLIPVAWSGFIGLRMELYREGTVAVACQEDPTGVNYRGNLSQTIKNHTCQEWTSQEPHTHDYTPSDFPNAGLDDNYCRNPSNGDTAWCYTTNPGIRWEYCDVDFLDPRCQESTPIPTTMTVHTTNPKTAISVQSDPVTSETTADTTTTSQPARGGRRLPPSGLALTNPPHTNDMTNLETTEADLETTAFPKTSGSPQTKTSGEETTSQGSGIKNQSDFTKTPREPRKGLLDTLAQMDEAQTLYVGLCVPMFVYFICFLTALVLRAITMWIQRLNKKKEPPPCMERPRLMYELVRLRSDDLNKCHRRKGIHK